MSKYSKEYVQLREVAMYIKGLIDGDKMVPLGEEHVRLLLTKSVMQNVDDRRAERKELDKLADEVFNE